MVFELEGSPSLCLAGSLESAFSVVMVGCCCENNNMMKTVPDSVLDPYGHRRQEQIKILIVVLIVTTYHYTIHLFELQYWQNFL